jgi:hypothetical protein
MHPKDKSIGATPKWIIYNGINLSNALQALIKRKDKTQVVMTRKIMDVS